MSDILRNKQLTFLQSFLQSCSFAVSLWSLWSLVSPVSWCQEETGDIKSYLCPKFISEIVAISYLLYLQMMNV